MTKRKQEIAPDQDSKGLRVQALFEFNYDQRLGRIERGQVFTLGGHANDKLLRQLAYVQLIPEEQETYQCGRCGKVFTSEPARAEHGDTWHAYTCDCGWRPERGTKDRAKALSEHRARCPEVREAKAEQREEHARLVASIKNASPVTIQTEAEA